MRTVTRLDHEARIEEAVSLILERLADPMTPAELADKVCFSRFHFHRVFQALLGETVGEMSRRLRLERAAHALRTSKRPITEIAFDAGYATHEAFIRAFRAAYGFAPYAFRKRLTYNGELPTPNGVHFQPDAGYELRLIASRGENTMNVELKELPTRRAVCLRHVGPYYMIGESFRKLAGWVQQQGIDAGMYLAIYYDDPQVTKPEDLTSDAAAYVSDDFTTDDPGYHVEDIAGGLFAVYTHMARYDGLGAAWGNLMGGWFPSSGYELGPTPPFEIYMNDCSKVAPADVRTDLYVNVKAPVTA